MRAGKALALAAAVLVLVPAASASITDFNVVNVFPTPVIKMQDTDVVVRLGSDSTTTTTAELWVTKPDGTLFKSDSETVTVKNGEPKEQLLNLQKAHIDQFGTYTLLVNETDAGLDDTLNISIVPAPQVDIRTTDSALQRRTGDSQEYVSIDINPRVGSPIRDDEIIGENLSLYQITGSTENDVEKNLRVSPPLVENNETGDLEAVINLQGLPEDEYSLILEFNITDCGPCTNFTEVESDSIRVYEEEDSGLIGLTAGFFLFAAVFLFIAFMLVPSEKGQKIFFIGVAWMFSILGITAVHSLAGEIGVSQVQPLAFAAIVVGTAGLLLWLIYIFIQTFTDIGVKIFGKLGT